ncbi:MAG: hypothetical protein WEA76_06040, partial [Acidimicrobiia bacterium]
DAGRIGEAVSLLREGAETHLRLGEVVELVHDLIQLAEILLDAEAPDLAAQVLAASEKLRNQTGFPLESWAAKEEAGVRGKVLAAMGDTAFSKAWEAGSELSAEDAIAIAAPFEGSGEEG